jgi:hypothetical protein
MVAPLFAAAVNDTLNEPVVAVVGTPTAMTLLGAAGDPTMTAADGADPGPPPLRFVACTVHEYVLPVVRPETVSGPTAPVVVPVRPALLDVHVTS